MSTVFDILNGIKSVVKVSIDFVKSLVYQTILIINDDVIVFMILSIIVMIKD